MARGWHSWLAALFLLAASADGQKTVGGKLPLSIRGQPQDVYFYPAAGNQAKGRILFAPGDGGWHGFAINIAETLAAWGYDVYGLDTRRYLGSFTSGKSALRDTEVMADMRSVAEAVRRRPDERLIFMGWSEGAGLAALAGVPEANKKAFRGLVVLDLPDYAVLGWRWTDSITYVTRQRPDEPAVAIAPYLAKITPLPFLMIHSTGDEYTNVPLAKKLFEAAREPKRFALVEAKNHRFDGNRDSFFRTLREGLEWMNRTKP